MLGRTSCVGLSLGLGLAACGDGGRFHHAPVDPALDLAIVVPDTMKRVEADDVFVQRADVFDSAPAWAADEQLHNQSFTVGAPTVDGDGWTLTMTANDGPAPDAQLWYRPLGGGLAITCTAIAPFEPPSAAENELARRICSGIQRVNGGIFVPMQRSKTEAATHLESALVDEPLNWSVQVERVADSPAWRLDPKGLDGRQHLLDSGTVPGAWFLSGGETHAVGRHYDVVARRWIGDQELTCYGDNYRDEAYSRRQLALCLGLEQP